VVSARASEELLRARERLGVLTAELKQQQHDGMQLAAEVETKKVQVAELRQKSEQAMLTGERVRPRNLFEPLVPQAGFSCWSDGLVCTSGGCADAEPQGAADG
jgi:hypothetical protein